MKRFDPSSSQMLELLDVMQSEMCDFQVALSRLDCVQPPIDFPQGKIVDYETGIKDFEDSEYLAACEEFNREWDAYSRMRACEEDQFYFHWIAAFFYYIAAEPLLGERTPALPQDILDSVNPLPQRPRSPSAPLPSVHEQLDYLRYSARHSDPWITELFNQCAWYSVLDYQDGDMVSPRQQVRRRMRELWPLRYELRDARIQINPILPRIAGSDGVSALTCSIKGRSLGVVEALLRLSDESLFERDKTSMDGLYGGLVEAVRRQGCSENLVSLIITSLRYSVQVRNVFADFEATFRKRPSFGGNTRSDLLEDAKGEAEVEFLETIQKFDPNRERGFTGYLHYRLRKYARLRVLRGFPSEREVPIADASEEKGNKNSVDRAGQQYRRNKGGVRFAVEALENLQGAELSRDLVEAIEHSLPPRQAAAVRKLLAIVGRDEDPKKMQSQAARELEMNEPTFRKHLEKSRPELARRLRHQHPQVRVWFEKWRRRKGQGPDGKS